MTDEGEWWDRWQRAEYQYSMLENVPNICLPPSVTCALNARFTILENYNISLPPPLLRFCVDVLYFPYDLRKIVVYKCHYYLNAHTNIICSTSSVNFVLISVQSTPDNIDTPYHLKSFNVGESWSIRQCYIFSLKWDK